MLNTKCCSPKQGISLRVEARYSHEILSIKMDLIKGLQFFSIYSHETFIKTWYN